MKQIKHIFTWLGMALLACGLFPLASAAEGDSTYQVVGIGLTTLSTIHPTLLDVTQAMDPDGSIARIAEILSQTNEVLDDMPWMEGNLATGHQSAVRTGLPAPTWRKLYGGVQPTKSNKAKITDTCGMLEDYAEIDKALADLNGNTEAFRLSEDIPHIEGLSQELAASLFYANEATSPEEITGFGPRFNDLSAENADNIIQSGTTPDRSIWLVGWGPQSAFGIYPKGGAGGLQMTDKGQVTIEDVDGSGGRMEAYRTHYKWDCGLVVKDWRFVVRAQIDYSELVKNAASGPDLVDIFQQMTDLLPSLGMVRPVFYADKGVRGFLRLQIMNKVAGGTLTMEDVKRPNGQVQKVPFVDGIPVRRVDALATTETEIS